MGPHLDRNASRKRSVHGGPRARAPGRFLDLCQTEGGDRHFARSQRIDTLGAMFSRTLFLIAACTAILCQRPAASAAAPTQLSLARFDIDATPPVGSLMAYDPVTNKWDLGLRARGIVLLGAGDPIVLCAIDWIGIANESHDAFQAALAAAAGTAPARVAVHTLHQHDAPECDFSAEKILQEAGIGLRQYEGSFQRQLLADLTAAVQKSLAGAKPVTHLGLGDAV